jgi:hypothetical protein
MISKIWGDVRVPLLDGGHRGCGDVLHARGQRHRSTRLESGQLFCQHASGILLQKKKVFLRKVLQYLILELCLKERL